MEALNHTYSNEPALYESDLHAEGFEWIDGGDAEQSVISFLRKGRTNQDTILIVLNFTPIPRTRYRVGVPRGGRWREILNSDAKEYGGSGWGNFGGVEATPAPAHGRRYSLSLSLPPLSALFFKKETPES